MKRTNYEEVLKGELQFKTIFKGIKEGDKTKISPYFIFILGFKLKILAPKAKTLYSLFLFLEGKGNKFVCSCGGKGNIFVCRCRG
jgi:hypothetical protein